MRFLLLSAICFQSLTAATIQWGGAILDDFYLSDGTAVTTADAPGLALTFELGVFDSPFDPNSTNLEDWRNNWQVLDTAAYNPAVQFFSSSFVIADNDISTPEIDYNSLQFNAGDDLYIWAYNALTVDDNLEWLLVTGIDADTSATDPTNSNWEVPTPAGKDGLPLEYRISTANTAVFGGLGAQWTDGEITDRESSSDFQFGTVPEPNAAFLSLLSLIGLLNRRQRN